MTAATRRGDGNAASERPLPCAPEQPRAAARLGVLRLLGRRAPVLLADNEAARALSLRPGHLSAIMDDMRAVLSASPAARQGLGPSALGSLPLAVLTHGIPFPPMAAVLEEGWSEAQQRLTQLSDNSELSVAARSNHLIHVDEPDVVIEAIRRVHTAARDGLRLADLPASTGNARPAAA